MAHYTNGQGLDVAKIMLRSSAKIGISGSDPDFRPDVPDHVESQGLQGVESSEEPARRRRPGVEADVAVNILRPVFGLYAKLAKLPREVDRTLYYFPTGNGVPSSP